MSGETDVTTVIVKAAGIPYPVLKNIARQMRDRGIPVAIPNLVRFALGKTAGIPDDELINFVIARPGRKPGNGIDDILNGNEQEENK